IEKTAQKILDVRSKYPDSSLAELYDPLSMPIDLQKAHNENDRAVLDAYGFPKNISESEIVSRLFEMYQELIRK
ncbi:MAG: class I SAM-dependent DNA methyltransferase, partial [Selenomonadaceae bacterium]|nr:class I SAM-dependent DNA methyltransferase [Selenomonadaceae bacterium]